MESRVLVVSLFAPYSVNFDAAQKTPQDIAAGAPTDNAASVHDKKLGRSGSTSRNSIWNGRRSSVHRTHTTPLGHHGQPHSRRRSTFSIKLAPVSRTSSDSSDLTSPMSPTDKHESSLATCAEGDTDEGTAAPTNTHLSKAGPSQLAFTIDEALGAHTPPANTLDFTRKMNLDLMREKQARVLVQANTDACCGAIRFHNLKIIRREVHFQAPKRLAGSKICLLLAISTRSKSTKPLKAL
ncbi:hypothetical protein BX070DRAFT_129891 [Coemansia spiralis]|nr:hypothetical protein BX070DRAFT_129891 [Coemansia spiralis]